MGGEEGEERDGRGCVGWWWGGYNKAYLPSVVCGGGRSVGGCVTPDLLIATHIKKKKFIT